MKFKINNLNCELKDFKKKTLTLFINDVEIGTIHKDQRCLRENDFAQIQRLVLKRLKDYKRINNIRVSEIPNLIEKLEGEKITKQFNLDRLEGLK